MIVRISNCHGNMLCTYMIYIKLVRCLTTPKKKKIRKSYQTIPFFLPPDLIVYLDQFPSKLCSRARSDRRKVCDSWVSWPTFSPKGQAGKALGHFSKLQKYIFRNCKNIFLTFLFFHCCSCGNLCFTKGLTNEEKIQERSTGRNNVSK